MHDLIFISIAIYLKMIKSLFRKMSINLNVHIFGALYFPFFARCSLSFELLLCCILDLRHISVMCCGSFFFPSLAIFNSSQFHNFFLVCVVTRAYHSLIHISLVFFFIRLFVFIYFYKLIVGGVLSLTLSVL